jgi:outer membrane protein OmpA-like peptidoglycan-associated protein
MTAGQEVTMKTKSVRVFGVLFASVWVLSPPSVGIAEDDHPLLSRMPGFHIDDYEEREFDAYEFNGPEGVPIQVEGRKFYIDYGLDAGEREPSELQILRNHTNAVEEIGGTVLHTDGYNAYLKAVVEGKEIWAHVRVYNQATSYSLNIIEREAMVQEVTANAESMARDLARTGKSAIYGIYFDFDKAEVKPESEPTLLEIGKLMRGQPELRIHVVGHTDNIGELDYNMDLSRRRAEAVVAALTSRHGIARDRLRPAGVGPLAPAATNVTEEGRALNRRVELVQR